MQPIRGYRKRYVVIELHFVPAGNLEEEGNPSGLIASRLCVARPNTCILRFREIFVACSTIIELCSIPGISVVYATRIVSTICVRDTPRPEAVFLDLS